MTHSLAQVDTFLFRVMVVRELLAFAACLADWCVALADHGAYIAVMFESSLNVLNSHADRLKCVNFNQLVLTCVAERVTLAEYRIMSRRAGPLLNLCFQDREDSLAWCS